MTIFFAYVDPGFFGSFYQAAYVLVFGVLLGWVLKPYQFLKGLFTRKKEGLQSPVNVTPDPSAGPASVSAAETVRPSKTP